ncbi:MAG: polysaccharide biosynthesis/export family protein [Planctomycetota bacterium]
MRSRCFTETSPRNTRIAAVLAVCLVVTACAHQPLLPLPPVAEDDRATLEAEGQRTADGWQLVPVREVEGDEVPYIYRLGAGDLVELSVWGEDEFSQEYRLSPEGVLSMPLFGDVDLARLTRTEAARRVEETMLEYYLDPRVAVIPKEYANARAYLLGRIKNPGAVDLDGATELLAVLSLGGGVPSPSDERIPPEKCTVIRNGDARIDVDLERLLDGDLSLNIPIYPGDVIYVHEAYRGTVTVLGDVRAPGLYPLLRRETVTQMIAKAGGFAPDALCDEIYLIRGDSKKPLYRAIDAEAILEEGRLEQDFRLQDGDILFVPKRFLGEFNYVLSRITPSLGAVLLGASAAAVIDGTTND